MGRGGGVVHIFMFCPTSFFWNQIQICQFEKKLVGQNMNIWINTPPINVLATALNISAFRCLGYTIYMFDVTTLWFSRLYYIVICCEISYSLEGIYSAWCLHLDKSSFLLFREARLGWEIIMNFSCKHRWHHLVLFEWLLHLASILHLIEYFTLLSIRFQTCLLSSAACLYLIRSRKELVWPLYLFLNWHSLCPTLVFFPHIYVKFSTTTTLSSR